MLADRFGGDASQSYAVQELLMLPMQIITDSLHFSTVTHGTRAATAYMPPSLPHAKWPYRHTGRVPIPILPKATRHFISMSVRYITVRIRGSEAALDSFERAYANMPACSHALPCILNKVGLQHHGTTCSPEPLMYSDVGLKKGGGMAKRGV